MDEAQARYRELVESGRGLICTHDLAGTLLSVNRAAADRLGYAPEEMVGKSLAEFLAPAARPMFGQYLDRIAHRPTDEGLMRVVTRAGEERIWTYSNVRRHDPDGLAYVLGHAQDVTDLKQSGARAAEAEALRSVAQLSLATAHEINNPLTVIIGSLQLLLVRGQVSAETAHSIERAIRAAEQIRDTVRSMSRITRLELSRQSPTLPDVLDLRKSSAPRA